MLIYPRSKHYKWIFLTQVDILFKKSAYWIEQDVPFMNMFYYYYSFIWGKVIEKIGANKIFAQNYDVKINNGNIHILVGSNDFSAGGIMSPLLS